jgi:hypothetical protein
MKRTGQVAGQKPFLLATFPKFITSPPKLEIAIRSIINLRRATMLTFERLSLIFQVYRFKDF